jgi:hypothetical protein
MRPQPFSTAIRLGVILAAATSASAGGATSARGQGSEQGWIELIAGANLDAWKPPTAAWTFVGDVRLDPNDPKKLLPEPGTGVLYNGPTGKTTNIYTKDQYGDLEVHLEFLIPKGSNSGIKLCGLYEIQILDTHGKDKLTGSDCGGIYPRAELKPKYHYLDDGHPAQVNAALPAGSWQTLDIAFRAPRLDPKGRKLANARFVKVVLNGQVIHENAEAVTPTGHAWVLEEKPTGPLMIQADHGPTAIRNLRIRPLASEAR